MKPVDNSTKATGTTRPARTARPPQTAPNPANQALHDKEERANRMSFLFLMAMLGLGFLIILYMLISQ